MTLALAVRDVAERTGLDLSQARARVGIGRGHLLEVVLQAAGFGSGVDDGALDAANLLLPRLVGDRVFDDWIAAVDVAPLARAPGGLRLIAARGEDAAPTIPIDELPAAVQAARDGAEASLPLLPYHAFCERAEWTLLEAGPSRRPASARLPDVPLLSTMVPEAAKCLLEGQRFSSCRFSRHGESFVLASLLLEGGDPEARLALRVELEERLDRALAPGGFGCVVGAGLGSRHAHLLLALPALDAGLDALARALRRLGADRDARLWPCDSRLAYEWVGVWEEPPRVLH